MTGIINNVQSYQLTVEIEAAEIELQQFVQHFSKAKLVQGPTKFYANLKTLEGRTACIELTTEGWRIISQTYDSTNEQDRDASMPTQHFETMQQLLSTISGKYRDTFASSLHKALTDLQKSRANE